MADRWMATTTEAHGWLKCKALKGYMIDLSFLEPQQGALDARLKALHLFLYVALQTSTPSENSIPCLELRRERL